ncbi:hypothetical protein UP09_27055 [Bradyrhizobium sp. LTSP885]|uniref:hypothetical protein n=1 Tax=Bradyrhizobium sp. LTSP885 TaxID=1619232 RepID=UPI0005C84568|nr:hypothetical protein [Bradyrhizobium sp. LTSP885]KJC38094.1 hypothetical protein UP09_27055 [Bradyrhizobium sp. LTSP885]
MDREIPRVEAVKVEVPSSLVVRWRGRRGRDAVNLTGWIATGGDILAPLKDASTFSQAHVASYGSAVAWNDEDLAIDAMHLKMLADEQRPFGNVEIRRWQDQMGISNAEAADLVNVSLSTWNSYRAAGTVPAPIGMLLRAMQRDPLMMQAHLRPRTAGRPRKAAMG